GQEPLLDDRLGGLRVRFRPFVYGVAQEFGVRGWVNNSIDGVHIEFNADKKLAYDFYQKLVHQPPVLAEITQHKITINTQKLFDNFQIIHSDSVGQANLLITPDFGMCRDCQIELHDSQNHGISILSLLVPIAVQGTPLFENCPTTERLPRWIFFQCVPIAGENTKIP
ncbi:MAG: acylphosphatase, partial [Bacteroidota bacterium]